MMCDELLEIAGPVVDGVLEHPFWVGLRDGTLPEAALWYFVEQDTRYVVPGYARAMARAAAIADDDADASLFCSAAAVTFESAVRMRGELVTLATELGPPADAAVVAPVGPTVHAHISFLAATTTGSFAEAAGGLLPMTWFHLRVCDDLRERAKPESRYAAHMGRYIPEDGFRGYVEAYLNLVEEGAGRCSAAERDRLAQQFMLGARYEWAFAETAWRRQEWAV